MIQVEEKNPKGNLGELIVDSSKYSTPSTGGDQNALQKLADDISNSKKDIVDTRNMTVLGLYILIFMVAAMVVAVIALFIGDIHEKTASYNVLLERLIYLQSQVDSRR